MPKHEARGDWEEMGAASGLLASLLLILGFLQSVSSGSIPDMGDAQDAPGFIAADLTGFRLATLFTSLGLVLFLWFLGTLWSTFRATQGQAARGSLLVVVGGGVGASLMLVASILRFTAALATSPAQADVVPTLYAAAALAFAIGGGCLSLLFFAAGKVILREGAAARWLGWFSMLCGVLAALAFMSPFFDSGLMDAATGPLGLWAWWVAFILWVFLSSLMLTLEERRRVRASLITPDAPLAPTAAEGVI